MKEMLTNKILTGLPDAEFARLMPLLQPETLSAGERLSEAEETARFIYFPENSVISCHAEMQDGKAAEVGMIGFEGLAGLSAILGSRPSAHSLNVLVAGSTCKVKKQEFERELEHLPGLRQALMACYGDYLTQVSQRAACAILHRLEQRLAVWLLMLIDRLESDVVEITQERIAQHLGVRRASVTLVAGELQALGAISYTRGSLRVVSRQTLERIACECYGALARAGQQIASI